MMMMDRDGVKREKGEYMCIGEYRRISDHLSLYLLFVPS